MRRVFAVVTLLLLGFARSAIAQPLPTDPRLVTGQCENGLKYIVVRHAIPPLRAQVWLHVRAGSMNETEAQRGAAHFISHLAFSGSENYPPESMVPLLASLGMRAGADQNSHSTFTETVYKFSLRESTPDALGKSLSLLRDIAQGLTLPAAAIDAERTAILAEQRNSATVDQRIQEFLLSRLAPDSIIGKRTRLGTPDAVGNLTGADLRAFYRTWYVPSNMTVVVVGDLDAAETVQMISATIGAGRAAPVPARPDLSIPPASQKGGQRAAIISDADLPVARVYLLKGSTRHPPVRTREELRQRVLDSLAVGAFNRRLGAKIATGKLGGGFDDAGSFASDYFGVLQLTGMYVAGAPGAWDGALRTLATELQRARLHGLHPSEVEETKKHYLAQAEQNVKNEPLRQGAAYAAVLTATGASGDAMMNASQTLDELRTLFDTIDAKAVSGHFAAMMDPSDALFMLAVPSQGVVPTEAELLAAGVEAMKVTPEAEAEFVMPDALMSARPAPGTVVEEQTHAATGVYSAWLGNGVRVHHRQMDINKGQATITVALAGGLIEESEITRGLTDAGAIAWSRPATSTLPSFAIQTLMEGKNVEVKGGPGIDNLLLGVTGAVDDLESGMQLVHLLLTDPVVETPGVEEWKRKQLELADARQVQPREVFNLSLLSMIYPASEVRPLPLTRAQLERLTPAAAQGWIRRLVADSPIEVSVVGDITRERAMELVNMYVGSLPARPRITAETLDDRRAIDFADGPVSTRREVVGLSNAAFIMAGFRAADADNLAENRLLGLAGQVINERFAAAVAAQAKSPDKIVHNVIVQSQPGQEFPGSGVFGAFATASPANADRAIAWIFEIFDAFAADGPTVEELASAKPRVTHQLEAALADPNFWTGQLSLLDYRGIPLDALADAIPPYQSITPDDVRAAFARYYRPESRLQMVLIQKEEAKKVAPVAPEQAGPSFPPAGVPTTPPNPR